MTRVLNKWYLRVLALAGVAGLVSVAIAVVDWTSERGFPRVGWLIIVLVFVICVLAFELWRSEKRHQADPKDQLRVKLREALDLQRRVEQNMAPGLADPVRHENNQAFSSELIAFWPATLAFVERHWPEKAAPFEIPPAPFPHGTIFRMMSPEDVQRYLQKLVGNLEDLIKSLDWFNSSTTPAPHF